MQTQDDFNGFGESFRSLSPAEWVAFRAHFIARAKRERSQLLRAYLIWAFRWARRTLSELRTPPAARRRRWTDVTPCISPRR